MQRRRSNGKVNSPSLRRNWSAGCEFLSLKVDTAIPVIGTNEIWNWNKYHTECYIKWYLILFKIKWFWHYMLVTLLPICIAHSTIVALVFVPIMMLSSTDVVNAKAEELVSIHYECFLKIRYIIRYQLLFTYYYFARKLICLYLISKLNSKLTVI